MEVRITISDTAAASGTPGITVAGTLPSAAPSPAVADMAALHTDAINAGPAPTLSGTAPPVPLAGDAPPPEAAPTAKSAGSAPRL
jgi:hypothetical protein